MNQDQKQKTAFGGNGSSSSDSLTVTHAVKAPSIDDVLAAARTAIATAKITIKAQRGGMCGCFGDN